MRRFLDGLYLASGAVAAVFIVAICLVVVVQVAANIINSVAGWLFGTPMGLLVPSYAEFTGFFLVAATFFALAGSLRAGSHIRVTLLIGKLKGKWRHRMELWCVGMAGLLSGYFMFFSAFLVADSYRFGDLAVGMVALPIWIPQLAMVIGLAVLTIALIDEFVGLVRGGTPSYEAATGSSGPPTLNDTDGGSAA